MCVNYQPWQSHQWKSGDVCGYQQGLGEGQGDISGREGILGSLCDNCLLLSVAFSSLLQPSSTSSSLLSVMYSSTGSLFLDLEQGDFQTLTEQSRDPVHKIPPSGEKLPDMIVSSWPLKDPSLLPVEVSHKRTVLPVAVATTEPSWVGQRPWCGSWKLYSQPLDMWRQTDWREDPVRTKTKEWIK